MVSASGTLALVGSGEYLPSMQELEAQLVQDGIARGKKAIYVQLATAAGQEGDDRIGYWRELGQRQAERIGVESQFLPVFDRTDAIKDLYLDLVSNAALIYFSGGDPHHLADSIRGTALWETIEANFKSGGSLAGCSAGAMFLSKSVPALRFLKREPVLGVGLLPNLQVIPHFDRFSKFVPDGAVKLMTQIPEGVTLTGIDEKTALLYRNETWSAWGHGQVHILNGVMSGRFAAGQEIPL